jgi:hypothetical protein
MTNDSRARDNDYSLSSLSPKAHIRYHDRLGHRLPSPIHQPHPSTQSSYSLISICQCLSYMMLSTGSWIDIRSLYKLAVRLRLFHIRKGTCAVVKPVLETSWRPDSTNIQWVLIPLRATMTQHVKGRMEDQPGLWSAQIIPVTQSVGRCLLSISGTLTSSVATESEDLHLCDFLRVWYSTIDERVNQRGA